MSIAAVAPIRASQDLVASFVERGFSLVFYQEREKGPTGIDAADWPNRAYALDAYRPCMNVGAKTGIEIQPGRFLHDLDFDWTPTPSISRRMLPPTGFAFGRDTRQTSHAFYTTPRPLVTTQFRAVDPVRGVNICEIRGVKRDGSIGHQTMIPPSVHPSGERLVMRINGDIAHVDDLDICVRNFAIAEALAFHLGERGLDHEARLHVAGFLLKAGVDEAGTIAICEAVAEALQNDVSDVATCVRYTAVRVKNGDRVTGRKALIAALGDIGTKVVARISEWITPDEAATDRDAIIMRGGRLSEIVDRAELVLIERGASIYQRGGQLVRPITLDVATGDTIRRSAGSTMIATVQEAWLLEQMSRSCRWMRSLKGGSTMQADPQAIYPRTLLHRGQWKFAVLRGIVAAPTLARDGRIIEAPGFDAASGLLLDFAADRFAPVPIAPTLDDAQLALDILRKPLRGFPFDRNASRSVALSSILTALTRGSLRTAPIHGFDAPTPGTGKSLLAEISGLIATGNRPPALSQGKTPEEDEKRLASVLLAGDLVVHLDNCERPIAGDLLCSASTQELIQIRPLGRTERIVIPSTALILASGNNLTFAGDVSRRVVICRLDARVERPDTRLFDFDVHEEIIATREQLVIAGLTILRAYDVAGRPVHLTPMGSFADYDWIRGALVWLGCADPADTRQSILDADPRRDELTAVMDLWQSVFGSAAIEVAHIDRSAQAETTLHARELRDKLIEVACRGGAWSGKSVGWWLRRHKDRIVAERDGDRVIAERAFRAEPGPSGQAWRLARVETQPTDQPGFSSF